jgi:hypothetical protein
VKRQDRWVLSQELRTSVTTNGSCDPEYGDFNHDGYNDLTMVSATAARGANVVMKLFIFDDERVELVEMKNSQNYPNLRYNRELDCIDAFLVYGGSSTCFLRIRGDSLFEFASVDCFDGLTVKEYGINGQERVLLSDTFFKEVYVRFSNYKPLKRYEDY